MIRYRLGLLPDIAAQHDMHHQIAPFHSHLA